MKKLTWRKDADGSYYLRTRGYAGGVEIAGQDMFGNIIVDAYAMQMKPARMLPLGNYGLSFPSIDSAKAAVERAIRKAMESALARA